jgi:OmcA/MtrC family decaheme c-type cytochrome
VAGTTADNHLKRYDTGDPATRKLGEQFKFEILSVTNVGENKVPLIRFKVAKPDGAPYDIVTDKAFTSSGASLNINIAWDAATDVSNAKADGSEPGLRSASAPRRSGYALQMNIQQIRAAAQVAGAKGPDGSYTIPFFTPVPVATTSLMVQMDGHPKALPAGETDWAKSVNAPAFMTVFYTGTQRPRLVTQAACENCHEYLSFHGGNRNGDPQACTICHNASGGYADEGLGPIAMGAMIHNIHASKVEEIGEVTYPQSLGNCETCHIAGKYNTAREGAIAISTGSGADQFSMTDDTWSTATAGTCGTCHDSGPAKAHMGQNGGAFDVVGGKTFTPSSNTEACAVCHGAGRPQDTVQVHGE